ncbi:MAG: glycosyltransferase family 2 protein [Ferruginibacter sp.]|nr:glycosyltransferase family 2 protein [Ferruginibacter sp.]
MSLPSVAIVILNWNGKKHLEKFLSSVVASSYPNKEVIVADNASTDDSIDFLKCHYPQVRIIQNEANEGFAKGYNEALRQIESDYYVLLNSDVEVCIGWIESVISLMESDKTIAACQPKILSYDQRDSFEYAGACGGWIDRFGYPFSRGRVFDVCEKDFGQYDKAEQCFWGSGAALFVRSDIYHELGGLDEYFFAHQEEIDLCWRMQRAGYKIFVQPLSVVYHVGGGTLPRGDHKKVYLNFRNNHIMLAKNLPFFSACWKIPFRFFLDMIAAYKGLLFGNFSYWLAIAKAHFAFFRWLIFTKKRKSVFPRRKVEMGGWYNGLLIWDYFVQKRRTFREIVGNK